MWVSKSQFVAGIQQAAAHAAENKWLLARVNQLEQEVGTLKHALTGREQKVPVYAKEATPPEDDGHLTFEDMGDELAKVMGVGV